MAWAACWTATYCPLKQTHSKNQFVEFLNKWENWFMIGENYNAKNTHWESRLTTPRWWKLYKAMIDNNLKHLSPRETTNWPTYRIEMLYLVDFCAKCDMPSNLLNERSWFNLSSDHLPLFISLITEVMRLKTTRQV